ncbi:MAG: GNAT family N-acetyltransferase [Candidatus Thorarchaeota archaeon]
MRIVQASLADTEWIIHHRIHMLRDMGVREEIIQEAAELFLPFLEKDWTLYFRYFLVKDRKNVIGGCGLSIRQLVPTRYSPSGKNAYIWNMYVEPDHRRKGIARALLRFVLDLCRKEMIGIIELHASEAGEALYTSEGFENWGRYMALAILRQELEPA